MYGDGLGQYLKFTMWFVPIAGVLAIWKLIELVAWAFAHVSFH